MVQRIIRLHAFFQLFVIATASTIGCDRGICDITLRNTLQVSSLQVMRAQKIASDFLLLAAGFEKAAKKNELHDTIQKFSVSLVHLTHGSAITDVATPPQTSVQNDLAELATVWSAFKGTVENNMDSVGLTSSTVFEQIEKQSTDAVHISLKVTTFYEAYAKSVSAQVPPLNAFYTQRQRVEVQKLVTYALFARINFRAQFYTAKVMNTIDVVLATHRSAVRGDDAVSGMQELTRICSLSEMMKVSVEQGNLITYLNSFVYDTEFGINGLASAHTSADTALESAVSVLTMDEGTCSPPAYTEARWVSAQNELSKQRLLTLTALRTFFNVANVVDVAENKKALAAALAEGSESLRAIIEGSRTLDLLPPPSQAIADLLFASWKQWKTFERDAAASIINPGVVSRVMAAADSVMEGMDKAGSAYVNASLASISSINSVRSEIARRQLTLMQKMTAEAMAAKYSKSENSSVAARQILSTSIIAFDMTVKTFELSHGELLNGRSETVGASVNGIVMLFPDRTIPPTKNMCTLMHMKTVLGEFKLLKAHLQDVVTSVSGAAADVRQIETSVFLTSLSMTKAVETYEQENPTCDIPMSQSSWKAVIYQAGRASTLLQDGQKSFSLIASGKAEEWRKHAEDALKLHQGYIASDAANKNLAKALKRFKDGWTTIADNDADRTYVLTDAYITKNAHALGEKHLLDFAPGNAQYHQAHKELHPFYRDVLKQRNYYDIFMFDTNGSLVYSVFKELDFATNFAAEGDGPWKTSGLGDAFRSALNNPDEVSVIDWRPYGPSAGALASFLSTGIRNGDGDLIGVYSTQMPPSAKPIDLQDILKTTVEKFDATIDSLKFGNSDSNVPSPPHQSIAEKVFAASDEWSKVKAILTGTADKAAVGSLFTDSGKNLASALEALSQTYIDIAWDANRTVPGTKINMAEQQSARMQLMCRDVSLIQMKMRGVGSATLKELIRLSDDAFNILVNGTFARRLQQINKTDVLPSTSKHGVEIMQDALSAYQTVKTHVLNVADSTDSTAAAETELRNLVDQTDIATQSMTKASLFFASLLEFEILETIDILAPVPLTGIWAAGRTMRVAAMVAEGLINDEQKILPGYELRSTFVDDKCDESESNSVMLREAASDVQYVGLGGAGCNAVCAASSSVARSLLLPFVSYDCPGESLSDTLSYPGLTRFGTKLTPAPKIFKMIGDNFNWTEISVVSPQEEKQRKEADALKAGFEDIGMSADVSFAYENEWESIKSMMDVLRNKKRRVIFIHGDENFARNVICASITVKANAGITWLSTGSWRESWWSKPDSLLASHEQWILQDAKTPEVRQAIEELTRSWEAFAATDSEREAGLGKLYITDLKENLFEVEGPEEYHSIHSKHHPLYRKQMLGRGYYDIFMFDMKGNCIYSVYKESDFATNFQTGKWKTSGLGDAFRAALDEPDEITVTSWTPYGPSGNALASFLSTGVKNEQGELIGVFATQLPPEALPIGLKEKDCTFEALAASFEGSINVAGLGQPLPADLEKPLPCFKHTAASFFELLDQHLQDGYPSGNRATRVADPYHRLKANAADASCVWAYTLQKFLGDDYTMEQIKNPTQELYELMVQYIQTGIDFQGVSGRVKFSGNDKLGSLGIEQVINGSSFLVGTYNTDNVLNLTFNGGITAAAWKPAFPDPPPPPSNFPFTAVKVAIPLILIFCPGLAGFAEAMISRKS